MRIKANDVNGARELLQSHLLARLFAHDVRNELVLKGGMAMRASTDSVRYTKDIDLSSPEYVSSNRMKARVNSAIKDLMKLGILQNVSVTMPKDTESTVRWKINGNVGQTHINLTVEVSRRPDLPMDHLETISWAPPSEYHLKPLVIDCLNLEAIAATKVSCLGNPKREAPRDIYDLSVLITMDVKPPVELLQRVGRENLEKWRENIWSKLEKMDYKQAQSEILPSLPSKMRSRLDEGTWDVMRLTVGEKVVEWIDEAIGKIDAADEEVSQDALAPG